MSEGKAEKVEGILSRHGKPFNATLQVNTDKKGIGFIFDEKKLYKQRNAPEQKKTNKGWYYGLFRR